MSEEQGKYQVNSDIPAGEIKILEELQGEIMRRVSGAIEQQNLKFLSQPYSDGVANGLMIAYRLIERYLRTGSFKIERWQVEEPPEQIHGCQGWFFNFQDLFLSFCRRLSKEPKP